MQNTPPFPPHHTQPLPTQAETPHRHTPSVPTVCAFGRRLPCPQPSLAWPPSGGRGSGAIHLTMLMSLSANPLLLSVNYIKHSQAEERRTQSVNFMMIYFSADGIIKAEAVHISQRVIFATLSQLGTALIRILSLSGAQKIAVERPSCT